MIARFLTASWPLLGMGAALLFLMGSVMILVSKLDAAKADNVALTVERDEALAVAQFMGDRVAAQNDAIRNLQTTAEENREIYLAGLRAAENRAVRLEVRAEDILALPSPETPDEQCEFARELLIGEIE